MSSHLQKVGDPAPSWTPPESPRDNKNQPSLLQFFKRVVFGGVSGLAAVPLIQPMIWYKGQRQEAASREAAKTAEKHGNLAVVKLMPEKFTADPRVLLQRVSKVYRGAGVMGASFAPTTALQTIAGFMFSGYMNPLAAATLAGVSSSLVVCPSELVMYQQQKTGKNFGLTAVFIYNQYGVKGFYRGMVHTGVREGGFTAGYLWGALILKKKFQEMGVNELASAFLGGIFAGTLAAVATHVSDTRKTLLQRDFTYKESFKDFLFKGSPMAGIFWRVPMVATATTVIPYVNGKLKAKFDE